MNNILSHKNFSARVDFDAEDQIFTGRLLGTTDIVGFHADTVQDLRIAFEQAVDDYLDTCARLGKAPLKTASGKLMLRVPAEVHRAALIAAQASGVSLNQWATQVLSQAAQA